MMRIAHLADLHLGTVDGDAEPARPTFTRAARRILTGGYAGVIVAGDVFDRTASGGDAVDVFLTVLRDWHEAGIPVALVGGNHDAENGLLAGLALPPSAHLFDVDAPGTIVWEHAGTALHGQSIRERDDLRDLAAGFPAARPGLVNIGILHTSLDGSVSRRVCAPTSLGTLRRAGYDYWALGHVHRRILLDGHGRIAYAGSVYGRASEGGSHGHLDVLLSAKGAGRRSPAGIVSVAEVAPVVSIADVRSVADVVSVPPVPDGHDLSPRTPSTARRRRRAPSAR